MTRYLAALALVLMAGAARAGNADAFYCDANSWQCQPIGATTDNRDSGGLPLHPYGPEPGGAPTPDRSWHLLTQSEAQTIRLRSNLTKDECNQVAKALLSGPDLEIKTAECFQ
jgi:hypothetical protein